MTTYNFSETLNTSITPDSSFQVYFDASYSSAQILLTQSGNNLVVSHGSDQLTLLNTSLSLLNSSNFVFADGSIELWATTGHDTILGTASNDTLQLSGLKQSDVTFQKADSAGGLLVTINATGETAYISNEFNSEPGYRIENFAFTDGTLTSDQVNVLANSQNLTTLSGVLTADNSFELYISTNDNELGTLVTSGVDWPSAYSFSLAPLTLGVTNYLHLVAHNVGGPGGVLGEFHLNNDLGNSQFSFSNGLSSEYTNAADWNVSLSGFGVDYITPVNEGTNGVGPWGYNQAISSSSQWMWNYTSNSGDDFNTEYFRHPS